MFFSGRAGEDFEAWLANFTVSAAINKWSDEMQRKMMLVCLRGQAKRFILGLPLDTCENLQQPPEAVHKRFLPPERATLHRAELRSCRRHPVESLTASSNDTIVLASRAYSDADDNGQALVQKIALDAFLDALGDSLRRRVREAEPADTIVQHYAKRSY